jgi:hypothetical protein
MRLLALCLLVGGLALAARSPSVAQPVPEDVETLFAVKVLPVLKSRCFGCHGDDPKDLRGGLDLSSRAGMLRGGDSGRPWSPGNRGRARCSAPSAARTPISRCRPRTATG